MYIDKSLKEYVADVSSGKPVPGGGSVAGLVASLGGALVNMAMNLTKDKDLFNKLDEETRQAMLLSSEKISNIIGDLNKIVDEDTKAFNSVLKAYKMETKSKEEEEVRNKKIEEGYKEAMSVPLSCMELSLEILKLSKIFAINGNKNLITDVGIGAILTYSAIESSRLNVIINLKEIRGIRYRKEIEDKLMTIMKEAKEIKEDVLDIVLEII